MPRTMARVALLATTVFLGFWTFANAQFSCELSCHKDASCVKVKGEDSSCECLDGFIDGNPGLPGRDCRKSGWSIRYVLTFNPKTQSLAQLQANIENSWGDADQFCLTAAGIYGRGVPDVFADHNADGVMKDQPYLWLEVNCLYADKPSESDLGAYEDITTAVPFCQSSAGENCVYSTAPQIYSWTLPTTSAPLRRQPTGLDVTSVTFDTACESSGCWVIQGVMTDGNAFNTFESFNSFFLPQAVAPGIDISYDHTYPEAWTFNPSAHPCTSVQFEAGTADDDELRRVSSCCIANNVEKASFIDYYRPSVNFIQWAEDNLADACSGGGVIERPGFNHTGGEAPENTPEKPPHVQCPGKSPPKQSWLDNHCWNMYTFSNAKAETFDDAEAQCVAKGGHLVSFHEPTDWAVFLDMQATVNFQFWTGLHDDGTPGSIGYTDNTPYDYELPITPCESSMTPNDHCPQILSNVPIDTFLDVANLKIDADEMGNSGEFNTRTCALARSQSVGTRALSTHYLCNTTHYYICSEPDAETCDSTAFYEQLTRRSDDDAGFDVIFPTNYLSFLRGPFKGLSSTSGVTKLDIRDAFLGQYDFEVRVDEVELRSLAGQLRGTVGVEYTVDTFLGLANFRPTGMDVLDTFATQVNLHLEKTNFFSVSTHGVNDYTFLEYVNMRLVSVYKEDADFSGTGESAARTVRTDSSGNVNYVQVTFTLGVDYTVNNNPISDPLTSGLIPLDSVRVGRGTFLDDVEDAAYGMQHVCSEYYAASSNAAALIGLQLDADGSGRVKRGDYDTQVAQACGPRSTMCASPSSIPDHFVSFNIPLGEEVLEADVQSNDLSNNIFVSMVVNALTTSGGGTPGGADDPDQMKTTLTASIPIVEGGINIFCDGFTAKTDLKDVANVDIIVGTAKTAQELTRLRIIEDVANTDLATKSSSQIDAASIESALMTLVIKGNHSYFRDVNTNTGDYTMELDDVITIHLMEDGRASNGPKDQEVQRLLALPGADNSDTNGLDTSGYPLNGAFYFTIDRDTNQAHLEPSTALLTECPFNPPRPTAGSSPLETCVVRRDVRDRGYPARTGTSATAMEVAASAVGAAASSESVIDDIAGPSGSITTSSAESSFLATILGDNNMASQLAVDFTKVIHAQYQLNGRYRRAYWINPGYEWTPTQTSGLAIFSVSQKIYLFALISLDENWTRRRMLLQTTTDELRDNGNGLNGASVTFTTTPKSIMASAFEVPEDRIVVFTVELALTMDQVCMEPTKLQASIRSSLQDYVTESATPFKAVLVTRLERNMGDEQCARRRSLRGLLATQYSSATAEVDMMVVFDVGETSQFNPATFSEQPGIVTMTEAPDNSGKVIISQEWVGKGGKVADEDGGGSTDTALIAGIAGGVVGAIVLAAGAVLFMRRAQEAETVTAIQTVDVQDLKSQLQGELVDVHDQHVLEVNLKIGAQPAVSLRSSTRVMTQASRAVLQRLCARVGGSSSANASVVVRGGLSTSVPMMTLGITRSARSTLPSLVSHHLHETYESSVTQAQAARCRAWRRRVPSHWQPGRALDSDHDDAWEIDIAFSEGPRIQINGVATLFLSNRGKTYNPEIDAAADGPDFKTWSRPNTKIVRAPGCINIEAQFDASIKNMLWKLPMRTALAFGLMMLTLAAKENDVQARMNILAEELTASVSARRSALTNSSAESMNELESCRQCYSFGQLSDCHECCNAKKAIEGPGDACTAEINVIADFHRFSNPNRRYKICPVNFHKTYCLHVGLDTEDVSVYPPRSGAREWRGAQWLIKRQESGRYLFQANPDLHSDAHLSARLRYVTVVQGVDPKFLLFDFLALERWEGATESRPIFRIYNAATNRYLTVSEDDPKDIDIPHRDQLQDAGWEGSLWEITEVPECAQ